VRALRFFAIRSCLLGALVVVVAGIVPLKYEN
jgi:hypothetical protein